MNKNRRYIFCGNRPCVLSAMVESNINFIDILIIENPYLRKYCEKVKIDAKCVHSKLQLLDRLYEADYDVFVSNGCPYILPISELKKKTGAIYINIHPSLLPDLRGADPVPGAILHGRPSGATCYVMDDKLDAGDIITQIDIGETNEMDVTLLYQLSFIAEHKVFLAALEKEFMPSRSQKITKEHLYYTFIKEDLFIDWNQDASSIMRRIRAFNNRSKGARFYCNGSDVAVFDCAWVANDFVRAFVADKKENEVCFVYENCMAVCKSQGLLILKGLQGDINKITNGNVLGNK